MGGWKINDGAIPESLRSKMREIIDRRPDFDSDTIPPPPWKEFPQLDRGSLGWRMGAGEDYMARFREWFSKLEDERKLSYEFLHPESEGWAGFYESLRR